MEKIFKVERITLLFSSFFLIVLIGLSQFSYPAVDDYNYAIKAFERGFWNSQVTEYIRWNGRYIATAILSFNPLTWGWFSGYQLIPTFLLTCLFGGLYFFLSTFAPAFSPKKKVSLIIIFLFLYWMRHFAIAQNLYWMSGSITHTLPLSLILITYSLLYKIYAQRFNLWSYFIAIFLTILIIGFNETIMLGHCFLLFMMSVYQFVNFKKIPKSMIFLLLVAGACFFFVLLAPGNSIRAARFEKSHLIFRTISNSLTYTIIYSIKFLSPAYILLFLYFRKQIKEVLSQFKIAKYNPNNFKIVCFTCFGLLYVSIAPSLWGMGRRPNDRTLNMVMFIYEVLFPILAYQIYQKYHHKLKKIPLTFDKIPKNGFIILLMGSFLFFNTFNIAYDLIYKIPGYQKVMKARFKLVNGPIKDNLKIEYVPAERTPSTVVFKDIDDQPSTFRKYFGLTNMILYKND